ncbi:MAG: hypothetical protein LIO90_04265 [Bacteroidales bacterium]|nr:hypothetical protein [Bacteroidales bacterium]
MAHSQNHKEIYLNRLCTQPKGLEAVRKIYFAKLTILFGLQNIFCYFCGKLQNMANLKLIDRPIYLNHIITSINRGMMIFLVGQRRVGKSYLLLLFKRWLEENRPSAHVLYIDKERLGAKELTDADQLYERATDIEAFPIWSF